MQRGGIGAADGESMDSASANALAQSPAEPDSPMPLAVDPPAPEPIPQVPADLETISGRIKWFDATKGYGFIVPDDGSADVLVHVTCLRRDGFAAAAEGARIVCEATRRTKGRQAFRVISLDLSTAVHPVPSLPRTRAPLVPGERFERATVKWFNRLRGFGFLSTGEGAPDIFVHMEILRRNGLTELKPGQNVLVRYGDSSKGRMAAEVKADPSPDASPQEPA